MSEWRLAVNMDRDYAGATDAVMAAVAEGATRAADQLVEIGKARLRADTRRGFADGSRLANTWRGIRYPQQRGVKSASPTVVLYSAVPDLARSFQEPAVITARNGRYICIPTKHAPPPARAPRDKRGSGIGRDWIAAARRAYPKMTFIPMRNGRYGVLAVDRWRDGKRNRLILFNCVRYGRLRKRMNYEKVFADLDALWPQLFESEVRRSLSRLDRLDSARRRLSGQSQPTALQRAGGAVPRLPGPPPVLLLPPPS
ncbi:MAG: hypothetical protein AAFY47_12290 [Pseudomonadota bacterium]